MSLAPWLFAGALTSLLAQEPAKGPAAPLPNVVLVLVDDQGFTGTSLALDPKLPDAKSRYYRTPQLERLAAQGMQFTHAFSPHCVCAPSRAAIQTGKSAAQLHLTMNPPNDPELLEVDEFRDHPMVQPDPAPGLLPEEITIAEFLKAHRPEYRTAHFGKWQLQSDPTEQGYDVSDGLTSNADGDHGREEDPKQVFTLTKRTTDFLREQAAAGHPCFVQLSHYAVHRPIGATPAAREKVAEWPKSDPPLDDVFAAMTWDVDDSLGRILDCLDELGDYGRNTYVLYFSDNGGASQRRADNLPLRDGKGSLFDGGLRVPLFVRGPGIGHKTLCEVPVIGTDFFPTIARWAGIDAPLPKGVEGGDLGPLLRQEPNAKVERSFPFLVFHWPHYLRGRSPVSVLFDGRFKLFHYYEDGSNQLFDLDDDPGELKNLADTKKRKVEKLSGLLADYLQEVGAQLPTRKEEAAAKGDGGP